MSNLAELIKGLEAEGKLDSVGDFTLDRKKAREKMKKYQLVDPHYYVLEIIQAAVASGATAIDVYLDADDCIITFDGDPYTREDLENMYSSLFMSQSDYTLDRYRELAIGINSAMALNPQYIRILSGDGEKTIELTVNPPDKENLADSVENVKGTKIHVKDRLSWRVASRFLAKHIAMKMPTEGKVLQEKCIYCRIPITLNESKINREEDMELKNVLTHIRPEWEDISGSVGIPRTPYKLSHIQFVKWGVLINSRHLKLSQVPLIGVIEANRLIKNVSQSDIVENDIFKETLKQLKVVTDEIIMKLAEDFEDIDPTVDDQGKKMAQDYLLQAVENEFTIRKYKRKPTKLLKKMAEVKLFEVTCGNFDYSERYVSLDTLAEQFDKIGYLPYAKKTFYEEHPDKLIVVYARNEKMFNLLNRIFNHQSRDIVEDFNRKFLRDKNVKVWKSKKDSPLIMTYDTVYHSEFDQDGIEAKIGLMLRAPDNYSRIKFFVEKGFISELSIEIGGLFFDAVLNNDALKPVFTWDDIERDEELTKSLKVLLSRTPALYLEASKIYENLTPSEKDVGKILRIHLLRYMNFVLPDKEEKAPDDKITPAQPAKPSQSIPSGISQKGLVCRIRETALRARVTHKAGEENEILIPDLNFILTDKFLNLPIFKTIQNNKVSLKDLEKDLEKYFKVHYVSKKVAVQQMDDRNIIVAGDDELAVLKKYFGWYKLDNYENALLQEQEALKNLNRPTENPAIWEETIEKVEINEKGFSGELGLLKNEDSSAYSYKYEGGQKVPTGQLFVKVLKRYRHIVTKKLLIPLQGVFGVVNYDDINVNKAWNDVIEDDKYNELKEIIIKACGDLAKKLMKEDVILYGPALQKKRRFLLQFAGVYLGRIDYEKEAEKTDELRKLIKSYLFFKTTEKGGTACIDDLMEDKKKFGNVAFVDKELEGSLDNDRIVVILDNNEKEILQDIIGNNYFENVEAILREKKISEFVKRTKPVFEPVVNIQDPLVKVALEHDEIKGEAALSRTGYTLSTDNLSRVQFLKENRLICAKQIQLPVPMVATANYDKLTTNNNWTDVVEDQNFNEVKNTLRKSVFTLVRELYEKYDSLSGEEKFIAKRYVLTFLLNSFSCFADVKKSKPGSFINQLAVLPLLPSVSGKFVSYLDVVDYYEKSGNIYFVTQQVTQKLLDPEMIVLILNQSFVNELKKHFFHFKDYSGELEEERIALNNMNKPRIKDLTVSEGFIVKVSITAKDMQGELAIPDQIPSQKGILFTRDRIPVNARPLYPDSIVFGIVENREFKTDKTFTDVILFENEKRVILQGFYNLYKELAQKFSSLEDVGVRETARKILLDFYYSQKNQVKTEFRIMDAKLENLVLSLPLLPITDGRWVELKVAMEEISRLGYIPYILKYETLEEPTEDVVFKFEMFDFDYKFCQNLVGTSRLKNYNEILKLARLKEMQDKTREEREKLVKEELEKRKAEEDKRISERHKLLQEFEDEKKKKREIAAAAIAASGSAKVISDVSYTEIPKEPEIKVSVSVPVQEEIPPEKRLLFALKREFRIIREVGDYKLSDNVLKDMSINPGDNKQPISFDKDRQLLVIYTSHPLIKAIMKESADNSPVIYYLLSLIYSTINRELLEITDEDEMKFQNVMLENLLKYSLLKAKAVN